MKDKPFYQETIKLFDSVASHNFEMLANLCDDDFGIVDLNEEGKNIVIRDRQGWEDWFHNLFKRLEQMKAATWTEVTNYEAIKREDMGYGVVDFDQILIVGNQKLRFSCIATIIWKKDGGNWKESRYHSSLLSVKDESRDSNRAK